MKEKEEAKRKTNLKAIRLFRMRNKACCKQQLVSSSAPLPLHQKSLQYCRDVNNMFISPFARRLSKLVANICSCSTIVSQLSAKQYQQASDSQWIELRREWNGASDRVSKAAGLSLEAAAAAGASWTMLRSLPVYLYKTNQHSQFIYFSISKFTTNTYAGLLSPARECS